MKKKISTIFAGRLAVSSIALLTAFGAVAPAWATIDNTVTVTGSSPGNTDDITESATENVDVEDPAPDLQLTKSAALTSDTDSDSLGDDGDVVTYTYTVTNDGNITMSSVDIVDTHDGDGALGTITFASWTTQAGSPAATSGVDTSITMAPGAVAVFTATYTINQTDIFNSGGTGVGVSEDGDIDNSAVASGDYNITGGGTASDSSPAALASIDLDADASLSIVKDADQEINVAAGTTVTYEYLVTNDGDVPITDITLSDTHKGVVGALVPVFDSFPTNNGDGGTNFSANTLNTIDILYPGDVGRYTVTYTVTQDDVDNLQ